MICHPFAAAPRTRRALLRGATSLLLAISLAACSDDNDDAPAAGGGGSSTVSGIAATGAAVSGGTVTARCSNAAGSFTATTAADGSYTLTVPAGAWPCALQLTGGNLPTGTSALYSYATASGTAHITPLTGLALAIAVQAASGQSLADWFASPGNWSGVNGQLGDALDDLRAALVAGGYAVPAGWTAGSSAPFTAAFTPDPASDPFDQLFEALADAIAEAGGYEGLDDLVAAFVAGGNLPDAPDPGTGSGSTPVGLAEFDAFDSSSTLADTATAVIGSHEVVVYKAPTLAETGRGTLQVSFDGSSLGIRLTLAGAASPLAAITVPVGDSSCNDGVCVQLFDQATTPTGGRRVQVRDYYADPVKQSILLALLPNGYFYGDIAGGYGFRNNLLAYGADVPAVFDTLAGVFTGPHETNTCLPNPVTVTIGNNGSVQLQGKTSLACTETDYGASWDGNDDYIEPTAGGARLVIDSSRIGGSQPGGGLFIDIADATSASLFSYLTSNFAGASGHITLPSPTRQ